MFTGIVAAVGRIVAREHAESGIHVRVDAGALDLADVSVGDSISVAGCCLTVVRAELRLLAFDVSDETLRCTTGLDVGGAVNLEKAMRLSDRLGGHLVSGHVDGVGTVTACEADATDSQGNRQLEIDVPAVLARYIAQKGSIAVDGVSMTTNAVAGTRFTVNLIPHTLAVTTLGRLRLGARVNVEVDLIARYVERLSGA
ncbi:MAG: riboflavin synthase [Casimicrobiaceae bacterium]